MFITLEDETDNANLMVWPSLFDKFRGVILGADLLTVRGRMQRADGVIHVIAEHLADHTELLRQISGSGDTFAVPASRGDEAVRGGGGSQDSRDAKGLKHAARDIFIRDLHIDTIAVKARNFR